MNEIKIIREALAKEMQLFYKQTGIYKQKNGNKIFRYIAHIFSNITKDISETKRIYKMLSKEDKELFNE